MSKPAGGPVDGNAPHVVGEQGPETIRPTPGATVVHFAAVWPPSNRKSRLRRVLQRLRRLLD